VTPTSSNPNFDKEKHGEQQGITNKPAAEEDRQQKKVPPRGTKKEDAA